MKELMKKVMEKLNPKLQLTSGFYIVGILGAIYVLTAAENFAVGEEIRGPVGYAVLVLSTVLFSLDIAGSLNLLMNKKKPPNTEENNIQ